MASRTSNPDQLAYELPAGPETRADSQARTMVEHAAKMALYAAKAQRRGMETPQTWIQATKRAMRAQGYRDLNEPMAIALGAITEDLREKPMRHLVASKFLTRVAAEGRFRADQVVRMQRVKPYSDTVHQSIAGTPVETTMDDVDAVNTLRDDQQEAELAAELKRKSFRIREDAATNQEIAEETRLLDEFSLASRAWHFPGLTPRLLRREGENSADELNWSEADKTARSPYHPVTDPLPTDHSILLAQNEQIPGRWTVVRTTTGTYPIGTQFDGTHQQRLDAFRAAGGSIYYARLGIEFAPDAICARHPWGRTREVVTIAHPRRIKEIRKYWVGDEVYHWVRKALERDPDLLKRSVAEVAKLRESDRNVPHSQALARYRQIVACPICALPITNPVYLHNKDGVTAFRNARYAARKAYFDAHKRWPSTDPAVETRLMVPSRNGIADHVLGSEPELALIGTVYRVTENLGAEWFQKREEMARARKIGPAPTRTREQWRVLNADVGKPPMDGLTFEIPKPWVEREPGPQTLDEREVENEEVLAELALDGLHRA